MVEKGCVNGWIHFVAISSVFVEQPFPFGLSFKHCSMHVLEKLSEQSLFVSIRTEHLNIVLNNEELPLPTQQPLPHKPLV